MIPFPDVADRPALASLAGPTSLTGAARADAPPATALLWQALLLGVSGDALLRGGPTGPALAIWILLLTLAAVALAWRAGRTMPSEAAGWLAVAALLATATAWRESEALRVLDVLATVGALGMSAIALGDTGRALLAPRLRETIWAALRLAGSVARGVVPLAVRELFVAERERTWTDGLRVGVRVALIAGAVLAVFGSLLRGADPVFARLTSFPALDLELFASHLFLTGVLTWIVGGWAVGAFMLDQTKRQPFDPLPITLGSLDVTTALGTLIALFTVFVGTQLGWFFGGERFLRETTGLTAAAYARKGFVEVVLVVMLVVPLLLATRAAMQPGRALARRHTLLSVPILVLLGAIITSAVLRLRLYVHHYGLTTDRLYALVFLAWLVVVLVALAATVLRDRGRPFAAVSAFSGLALLAGLHLVVPDVVVARVNVARAHAAPGAADRALDLEHLTRLSGDAAGLATMATLDPANASDPRLDRRWPGEQRCLAAKRLLDRWGPASRAAIESASPGAWRTWNAGERSALRVVGGRAAELRAAHDTCRPMRAAAAARASADAVARQR